MLFVTWNSFYNVENQNIYQFVHNKWMMWVTHAWLLILCQIWIRFSELSDMRRYFDTRRRVLLHSWNFTHVGIQNTSSVLLQSYLYLRNANIYLRVEVWNSWIAVRNSWIAIRNSWIAVRNSWIAVRNNWIAVRNSWIAARNSWIAVSNSWIEVMNSWIAVRNNWIAVRKIWISVRNIWMAVRNTCARIYRPGFAKTSPKRSFSVIENEHFGLVFVKTGPINSGTGFQ